MRITNSMIAQSQILSMQNNLTAVNQTQQQISSGLKYQTASDNPMAATQIMDTSSQLAAVTQYQANVSLAQSRNSAEDTALQQITDLLTRAKELAVSAQSPSGSAATDSAAETEVEGIFNQAVSIASQKFGDGYLFGGDQTQTAPFTATGTGSSIDYTTSGGTGTPSIVIGPGQVVNPVHDGSTVFVASGVLDSLKQLTQSLSTGTGVSAASDAVDSAFDNLQTLVGDVGATGNRLSTASSNLSALSTNLQTFQSSIQDVDVASATVELSQRQTAYQAALLATSKITGMSLANYLTG